VQAKVSIQIRVQKVQNDRQSQGQGRQKSIIQCDVTRYRTAGRLRVRAGRMFKTGKTRRQELETDRIKGENNGRLNEQNELATDKQNTCINTLGIIGKMGDTPGCIPGHQR
jgi:hypothetical protein